METEGRGGGGGGGGKRWRGVNREGTYFNLSKYGACNIDIKVDSTFLMFFTL